MLEHLILLASKGDVEICQLCHFTYNSAINQGNSQKFNDQDIYAVAPKSIGMKVVSSDFLLTLFTYA